MEGTLGQIILFAGNFAPRNWAFCHGQLIAISQNTALFSILGTTYGGDGRTTFGLPDLRSRVPLGAGQGPGLRNYRQGQAGGQESVTLQANQLPSHTHAFTGSMNFPISEEDADQGEGAGNFLANGTFYHAQSGGTYGNGAIPVQGTVQPTGGNQAINIAPPSLAMHYVICIQGIFPSRS